MILDDVKAILTDVLSLSGPPLTADSPLLGAVPELDSMAVVQLIGALENHFGIAVDDDEVSASHFETVGALCAFVEGKMG